MAAQPPPLRRRAKSTSLARKPTLQHHQYHRQRPMTAGNLSAARMRSLRGRPGWLQPTMRITEAEFRQLPPSIQRKCFSSFERLKIQQSSAKFVWDPTFVPRAVAPPPSHPNSLNHSSSNGSSPHSSKRLKKPQSVWTEHIISQAEAQWFLSLPDKIRRQHFSREEQVLLAGRLNFPAVDLAVDFSDEKPVTPDATIEDAVVVPIIPISVEPIRRLHSFSEQSTLVQSFELELEPSILSNRSLDDLPTMNCFDDPSIRPRSRRPSLRRRLSASRPSTSIFRSSTSSTPPMSPSFQQQHSRTRSATTTMARPSNDSALRAFDPNAVYYQDPEARNKLRQYLASPQKFDEAVEFGFPSNSSPASPEFDHVRSHFRSTSNNDAQTFLRDDVISFIDRYDEDSDAGSSDTDSESPVTPADANDDVFNSTAGTHSLFSSLDSNDLPPLDFKFRQYSLPQDPMANREMTLRMTLTRPDLRAPEEELYGWQDSHDNPLALEELPPPTDDNTGAHGPFAGRGNRNSGILRRFFSKVKK